MIPSFLRRLSSRLFNKTTENESDEIDAGSALSHHSTQDKTPLSKRPTIQLETEEPTSQVTLSNSVSKTSSDNTDNAPLGPTTRLSSTGRNTSLTSKPILTGRAPSLTAHASRESVAKKPSVNEEKTKKKKTNGEILWYRRGACVTVRNDEGGWFLCKLQHNVYNTTKSAKIRWMTRMRNRFRGIPFKLNYALDNHDEIDPACILYNVRVTRNRSTYTLCFEDKLETEKLLKVAADVASGNLTCDDVDSDVEEVVQIEPPLKKRRTMKKKQGDKTSAMEGKESKRKNSKKKQLLVLYPNPDVKVWKKDLFFETNRSVPFVSKYAYSRLAFRAVHMKDYDLLRKLCKETEKVKNLKSWRSVADQTTALHHAITLKDKEAITLLSQDMFRRYGDGTGIYEKRNDSPGDQVHMTVLDTGKYNYRSQYRRGEYHVRPIMASRGTREGNNALTKDVEDMKGYKYVDTWDLVPHMMKTGLDCDTVRQVFPTCALTAEEPKFSQFYTVTNGIDMSLERGHYRTAGEFLKYIVTALPRMRRITPLHYKVLLSEEELETIPPKHIKHGIKLAGMITPIHCAACNPDTRHLEKLLQIESDVHLSDRLNRRLIHFAAGCVGTGPLELLVKRGANILDCDHQGNTPLHFAARANRVNNAQILLDAAAKADPDSDPCMGKYGIGGIDRPNRSSYSPLHLAVENNSLDVVKLLVENEANMEAVLNTNSFKVTPLMLAAQFGFFDIAVFLVKSGAVAQHRDRLGRTAVIHAAMNGNTNVLSYLLKIGANPNLCDTSDNSPLHYAAAYGWYFCVKTLLGAGADVNVTNNWKTTPLSAAYLKGHVGIVNLLLTDSEADVDFQDDKGMTLVSIAARCYLCPDLCDQMQFLIKDNRALCTFTDIDDCTPLHHLARNNILLVGAMFDVKLPSNEAMETSVKIAKLLIKHGCDHKAVDKKAMTAAMAAMRTGNVKLFKFLVQTGCPVLTDLDKDGDNILHHLCYDHMDSVKDYLAILKCAAKMDGSQPGNQNLKKDFCDMARVYCQHGTTPLLAACQQYRVYQTKEISSAWLKETEAIKRLRRKRGRDLIQFLIDEFDSDVNAVVRDIHDENDNDKPSNKRDRYQEGLAKSSVAQMLADVKNCEYGGSPGVKDPVWPALRMLLKYKPNMNTRDCEGHTPLTRALSQKNVTVAQLLVKESNADTNDSYRNTGTVMIAVMSGKIALFDMLVKAGADLTVMSETDGNTLLHSVIVYGDRAEGTVKMMQTLLDHGADVNVLNKEKKTPLHLAVNLSDGNMDDNYDVILFLLEKGADLTIKDVEGRIPLHYVFFKIRRSRYRYDNKHHHDPVELCRMIASKMTTAELNIQDNFGMTALHRAAFRGANICCMYLMQKGADMNLKDNDGNTALGMAVKGECDGCSTILIQNGASLRDPVVYPSGEETEDKRPYWKWAPIRNEGEKKEEERIPLFECAIKTGLEGVCFLMMEKPVRESGITFGDAIQIGLKLETYNIVLRLLTTTADVSSLHKDRHHGRNLLHVLSLTATSFDTLTETVVTELVERGVSLTKQDDYMCTPLLYASLNRNYKLCNFFMSHAYNPKYKDSFHRSVLSASFWKTNITYNADLTSWISELREKKASLDELIDRPIQEGLLGALEKERDPDYWRKYDCVKISPLIVAIHNLNQFFTQWILKKGASVNQADSIGRTPLMHAVRQNDRDLVKTLMNFEFDPQVEESESQTDNETKKVMYSRGFQLKRKSFQMSGDEEDSKSGEEEEEIEEEEDEYEEEEQTFKPYKKVSNVNLNAVDKNGWTVMHHAVCPLSFGTFDNDEIVFILAKAGAKLNLKNKKGDTPLDLAIKKGASRIARMIQRLENVSEKNRQEPKYSTVSVSDNMKWTNPRPSFHEDAERLREKLGKPMDVENEYEAKIDSNCDINNGTLVKDEDQDRLYDVLLTKVDLDVRGPWGVYNFYLMQLIYQRGKNLYVLFTRWGRIGDKGQYQYTPYKVKDEAVKEFCKIFREKTGNKWTEVKSFVNMICKYRLVHNKERCKQLKPTVMEFESKSTVKSRLPSHLQHMMEEMSNMNHLGVTLSDQYKLDTDILPFGSLQRDQLLKARTLLEDIRVKAEEVDEYREKRDRKSEEEEAKLREKYQQNLEQIEILSSEYFQVIPQREFVYEKIRPLDYMHELRSQIKLVTNLLDYEVANSMLLGAKYREKEVNPLDYVYQSLGCQIQLMAEGDEESQYILKYIASSANIHVEAIYRVEVEGEQARMDKKYLDNHHLLWHGSGVANFLSILHRGLVIAPPDAPTTGHLFGKGIYFSDTFCKSFAYCSHNNSDTKTLFMLLCEVALGRSKQLADNTQKPVTGYDSLFVLGRQRPQDQYNVRLQTGCVVPLGELKTEPRHKGEYIARQSNEYIVFDESQVCLRYLVQFK